MCVTSFVHANYDTLSTGRAHLLQAPIKTYRCYRSLCLVQDLFTAESLAAFRGQNGGPMYLAILGEVFDVSKGRKKYGKIHCPF